MDKKAHDLIHKLAASRQDNSMRGLMDTFIDGAVNNGYGRTVTVQEDKLAAATPLDLAHMAGTLQALSEQGFSLKEASEYLQVPEATIQAVLVAVK